MSVMAFREKAGRSQVGSSVLSLDKIFLRRVATVATLPFALSMSDLFRSVPVGCSRFSRCCHLFIDLPFHPENGSLGQAINAVTGTRRLGFVFPLQNVSLRCCRQGKAAAVPQWFVHFSAHPQTMQLLVQFGVRPQRGGSGGSLGRCFGRVRLAEGVNIVVVRTNVDYPIDHRRGRRQVSGVLQGSRGADASAVMLAATVTAGVPSSAVPVPIAEILPAAVEALRHMPVASQ
jgi:hypothetical protein